MPDAIITQPELATGVSGTGPAFSAYCSTAQLIPNAVFTKIQINTELFDTNSNFDSTTNYRFTPTVAGYYQVSGAAYFSYAGGAVAQNAIFKNGVLMFVAAWSSTSVGGIVPVSGLVYMNGTTDFLELYSYQGSGLGQTLIPSRQDLNYFFGSLVRAA